MSKTITRMYDNYEDAKSAVAALETLGIPHNDISIVARRSGEHSITADDAGIGATTGALIGGVGGLLAGLGLLASPGLGAVVAAGWLASTAVGAGVGAIAGGAAGGFVGALQEEGVTEHDANVYSEGVRRGGSLVSAKVKDDLAPQAEDVLNRYGPVNPAERGASYRERGWTAFDPAAPAYGDADVARERDHHEEPRARV